MSRPSTMFSMRSYSGNTVINLPNPDTDSGKNLISTLVNSARSASTGEVVAQKICRDQEKTELSWNYLSKETWEKMLAFWDENFYFYFTYYSRVEQKKITRVFYIGDRSDQPFNVNERGIPTAYQNCVANVIDTGVSE